MTIRTLPRPAHMYDRLPGPRGVFHSGEVIGESIIQRPTTQSGRDPGRWQWWAKNTAGEMVIVVEVGDLLPDVCDTREGALWAIRDIAGSMIGERARAHKS